MSDRFSIHSARQKNIHELVSRNPIIAGPCELDLLMFLYRHPRTLLTNEQLAAFVGYDTKQIAKSIDSFIDAGLLERTQNPMHAARMYLLVLNGPQKGGLMDLFEVASTRQGRKDVLKMLDLAQSSRHINHQQSKRKLHAVV